MAKEKTDIMLTIMFREKGGDEAPANFVSSLPYQAMYKLLKVFSLRMHVFLWLVSFFFANCASLGQFFMYVLMLHKCVEWQRQSNFLDYKYV